MGTISRLKKIVYGMSFLALASFFLEGCAETQLVSHAVKSGMPKSQEGMYKVGTPYKVGSKTYYPKEDYGYEEVGMASWYGPGFHGKKTANGETYNQHAITAAHRTAPMPSIFEVTNLDNGRTIRVRCNDRGPYKSDRIIDLSERAAKLLGVHGTGTARVKVKIIPDESKKVAALAKQGQVEDITEHYAMNAHKQPSHHDSHGLRSDEKERPPLQVATLEKPKDADLDKETIAPIKDSPIKEERLIEARVDTSSIAYNDKGMAQNSGAQQSKQFKDVIGKQKFYVQAGSFKQEQNAVSMQSKYKSLGRTEVAVVKVNDVDYHRVMIGPFESASQADAVLENVVKTGGIAKKVTVID